MAKPKRPSLLGSITNDIKAQPVNTAPRVVEIAPKPTPPQKKPKVVKSTVYLPSKVHRKLKEIAFARDCKIHDLIMEGLSHVLTENGHPSVDELKK